MEPGSDGECAPYPSISRTGEEEVMSILACIVASWADGAGEDCLCFLEIASCVQSVQVEEPGEDLYFLSRCDRVDPKAGVIGHHMPPSW